MAAMIALLLLATLQAGSAARTPPPDRFMPLAVYNGTWSIQPQGAPSPDRVEDHCTAGQSFFTCEQIVNGASVALLVFTPSKNPGEFAVANVLPDGQTVSGTDLVVNGDHWTYISKDANGHPHHRTENVFHGRDAIHYEQFTSSDGGQTWTKAGEGEEHRVQR